MWVALDGGGGVGWFFALDGGVASDWVLHSDFAMF